MKRTETLEVGGRCYSLKQLVALPDVEFCQLVDAVLAKPHPNINDVLNAKELQP